jgi:anti-sigma factor RsiW
MMCITRDQDILLLAHGELSLRRRIRTQAHLRHCASCRERYRQLENTAHTLAGMVRGPLAAPWSPALNNPSAGPTLLSNRLPLLLLTALLTFVTVATLYVVFSGAISYGQNAACQPSVPLRGCAPGLPNDQCR